MFVFYFENILHSFPHSFFPFPPLPPYDLSHGWHSLRFYFEPKGENIKHIHYIGNEDRKAYCGLKPHWFNFSVLGIKRFPNGVTMTFSMDNLTIQKIIKNRFLHNVYWALLRPLGQGSPIRGAGRMALCRLMGFMPISHLVHKGHPGTTYLAWVSSWMCSSLSICRCPAITTARKRRQCGHRAAWLSLFKAHLHLNPTAVKKILWEHFQS